MATFDSGFCDPQGLYQFGLAAGVRGDWNEAARLFQAALQGPNAPADAAGIWNDLGVVQTNSGEYREAQESFLRGLALDDSNGRLWINLASCLVHRGDELAAVAAAERALETSTDPAVTFRSADFLSGRGLFTKAIRAWEMVIEQGGGSAGVWTNLGSDLSACGRVQEGIGAYRRAIEADPAFQPAHSNLLFSLHLDETLPPEAIADRHFAWGRSVASSIRPCFDFCGRNREPRRRLRIGVLSSDLRRHSIVYFLAPILEDYDPMRGEIVIFSNVSSPDQTTERLRAVAPRWIDVHHLDAEGCARRIFADEIDVLIEIGGHTSPKTLEVLARKPAPVQISYLAYPDTTGLSSVDYVITDEIADPSGRADHLYSERLLRLAPCLLCYRPPATSPPIGSKKAIGAPIVFGSFAQRQKLSNRTLSLWVSILRRVPNSELLLKALAWNDPALCAETRAFFAGHGVEPERIQFAQHIDSLPGHLELYNCVDIALDTFPYSGITTTCEALWMGVPVITLPGRNQVSRICASILTCAGLPDLVAESEADYVNKAVDLASAPLQAKASLREVVEKSPLLQSSTFASQLESALAGVWQSWASCEAAAFIR